ncbi:SDR family NAD(P)-dependent oxidoreductase [Nocardioides jensenii]|uniref:SDR family NAD(P)-dependent oxidoreductase n=1 Tax=Nocardioides jensenii TaxID=1843 RepID=UPI0009E8D3F1|nr:SDR family oxidoreductase [Nocardioides jensenii]
MRFEDHVLVCTGAGSGIGAAVARQYASEGGRVVLLGRRPASLERVAADCPGALAVPTDVSDAAAVRRAVDETVRQFGRIDSVYNGAAVLIPTEAITADPQEFVDQFMINAVGTLNVCQAAAPALRDSPNGSIVNTSSVVVDIARANRGLYAASKGTIPPLTRHLALELGPTVRVNALSPGHTLTEMTEDLYAQQGESLEEGLSSLSSNVMLGRVAMPPEMASVVCFLLSTEARYMTGQTLTVDAGMTAV